MQIPSQLTCLWLAAVAALTPFPSYAYLDPGTGSMAIQLIIGAIAGVGLSAKLYWHKLRTMFARKEAGSTDHESAAAKHNVSSE